MQYNDNLKLALLHFWLHACDHHVRHVHELVKSSVTILRYRVSSSTQTKAYLIIVFKIESHAAVRTHTHFVAIPSVAWNTPVGSEDL